TRPAGAAGQPDMAGDPDAPGPDDPAVVQRSCLAQLAALYPEEFPGAAAAGPAEPPGEWPDPAPPSAESPRAQAPAAESGSLPYSLEPALLALAERGVFRRRPL